MKDKVGIYYYPFPDNKRVRMYVREKSGEIEFRMKNEDDPECLDRSRLGPLWRHSTGPGAV
jgi:hypothetical protein